MTNEILTLILNTHELSPTNSIPSFTRPKVETAMRLATYNPGRHGHSLAVRPPHQSCQGLRIFCIPFYRPPHSAAHEGKGFRFHSIESASRRSTLPAFHPTSPSIVPSIIIIVISECVCGDAGK